MRTKIIVNPNAGQRQGEKLLPQIKDCLSNRGVEHDLVLTTGPRDAIELAAQAVRDGFERVVAVGGDGTVNEVVNGLMAVRAEGKSAVLGIIPIGSGNDFAFALGLPNDVSVACDVLKNTGTARTVDVTRVVVDGKTWFYDNNVGIGFDGEVVVDLGKKRYLSGFLMYLWSVFRVISFGRWPFQMDFSLNGEAFKSPITLITVANGSRSGGGFLLTPDAKVDDGQFDICYVGGLSKLGVLNLLPRTINGSHIRQKSVVTERSDSVIIRVPSGSPAHIDGEVLCTNGKEFIFDILPGKLKVWAPKQ